MTNVLLATTLAIGSAAVHATWNFRVKSAEDGELASAAQFGSAGLLGVLVLLWLGPPPAAALPWLAASAAVHLVYVRSLVAAYGSGDFSLGYPLARGGGRPPAAGGGALGLAGPLRPMGWAGAVVVAIGLVSLVDARASSTTLGWAGATAAAIGSYTVIDSRGVRTSGAGDGYVFALMALCSVGIVGAGGGRGRGPDLLAELRRRPGRRLSAGAMVTVAYGMALVAVRHAPVGYVALLRESSVVFGAAIGWFVLHERLAPRRLVSTVVILVGFVGLVLAQR